MTSKLLRKRVLLTVVLAVPLTDRAAVAETPQESYYQAYYLQHEKGDFAAAAKLYREVAQARDAHAELRRLAGRGLTSCQEELASADLMGLMPPEALVYAELTNPGEQVTRLLGTLGLLATADHARSGNGNGARIAVSPVLIRELLGLRGAAVAVTGFNPQAEMPTGVAVINPGNLEWIRGAIETALPVAAEAVDAIKGRDTYFVGQAQLYVCLTSRLIIASPDKGQIEGVLNRIDGSDRRSFADNAELPEAFAGRDSGAPGLLFFCVNAKKLIPLLMQMPGAGKDMAQARAILDLDSLQWIAGRAGVDDGGLYFEAGVRLDKGHHNLAYNLIRTPPISRETLTGIPSGVAGFVAGALNEPGTRYSRPAHGGEDTDPTVTGLDIGREIFANVKDFAVFALPPTTDGRSQSGPIPHLAAVVRVHDASRSEALWTQILGIASMAAGAPSTHGGTERIAGLDARTYQFPEGIKLLVATGHDRLFVATTPYAMSRAVASAKGGQSVLDDQAFAAGLKNIDEHTSKAIFVNPGRCLQIAQNFMSESERRETAPFVEMLGRTVASLRTSESPQEFRVSAQVTGLPNMGPFLSQMIEREHRAQRTRRELSSARRSGNWDQAVQTIDKIIEEDGGAQSYRTKFEILALDKKDHPAAVKCAQALAKSISENPTALNNFAWELLTNDDYQREYDDIALRIAEQACRLTDYNSWALLDTLALVKFRGGRIDEAIELQDKALKLQGGNHKEMIATLERYRAAKTADLK